MLSVVLIPMLSAVSAPSTNFTPPPRMLTEKDAGFERTVENKKKGRTRPTRGAKERESISKKNEEEGRGREQGSKKTVDLEATVNVQLYIENDCAGLA